MYTTLITPEQLMALRAGGQRVAGRPSSLAAPSRRRAVPVDGPP